ncbi:MAG: protein kinase [Bacteroidaceae bacterium]|nr:protein kinase [Bacteroidaceae bacterium]
MTLQSGSLLQGGKYRVERVLGQGGFGIAYLAEQVALGRKVAIKEFFMRELCGRDSGTSHVTMGMGAGRETVRRFREKFLKEARNIASLDHPGIVRIYDVFEENGTAYYVMEYIEGESLGDMVERRGCLPQVEALSYIRTVGDALTYIHKHNINHLDIKPSNIMLRRSDMQTILIDFGVSKQHDLQTKKGTTTTPVGISHGYSPAEQYNKNGIQTFSPQSDVYALAATLFKLLTGQTPPEATGIPDMGLPVEDLRQKGVSDSVIQAIVHAMRPRSIRTQSVTEFILNLESKELNVTSAKVEDGERTIIDTIITGKEDSTDYEKLSIRELEELAKKNDTKAQYYLGKAYYNGAEAVEWYRKYAEQGFSDAQYNLGDAYHWGKGVEQDYAEAVKWYRKSAEQGNSVAQFLLGCAYYSGVSIERDYVEAVKWFRKSAEQGDSVAQFLLGWAYYYGEGVERDYVESAKWYRKSAEQGNSDAQYHLGYAYYYGKGVERDYVESAKWYRKSAEQGNSDAQYHLGYAYYNREGVIGRDYAESVKWYRKSAEQGNSDAQYHLGRTYYNGVGVERDRAEGVKWIRKSAEQGNENAIDWIDDDELLAMYGYHKLLFVMIHTIVGFLMCCTPLKSMLCYVYDHDGFKSILPALAFSFLINLLDRLYYVKCCVKVSRIPFFKKWIAFSFWGIGGFWVGVTMWVMFSGRY